MIVTHLDIHVPAGKNASQEDDVFFVTVHTILSHTHYRLHLVNYDRISSYGQYQVCADDGVDIKLCVCSLIRPIRRPEYNIPSWHLTYTVVFGNPRKIQKLNNSCLYIYERRMDSSGIILEASSDCRNSTYMLEINPDVILNIVSSSPLPHRVKLCPGDMTFLLVFQQKNTLLRWTVKYTTNYEEIM